MIILEFLKASSVFKLILIPFIFLLIFLLSVIETNLKFLSDFIDFIIKLGSNWMYGENGPTNNKIYKI